MTQAAKMTQLAIAALEDKKAEDITLIDIAKVSVLAGLFPDCKRKQPKPGAGNGGQCRRTNSPKPAIP